MDEVHRPVERVQEPARSVILFVLNLFLGLDGMPGEVLADGRDELALGGHVGGRHEVAAG